MSLNFQEFKKVMSDTKEIVLTLTKLDDDFEEAYINIYQDDENEQVFIQSGQLAWVILDFGKDVDYLITDIADSVISGIAIDIEYFDDNWEMYINDQIEKLKGELNEKSIN